MKSKHSMLISGRLSLLLCRLIGYLKSSGFYKQSEVTFPHKQSAVMKIDRESWEAPTL